MNANKLTITELDSAVQAYLEFPRGNSHSRHLLELVENSSQTFQSKFWAKVDKATNA